MSKDVVEAIVRASSAASCNVGINPIWQAGCHVPRCRHGAAARQRVRVMFAKRWYAVVAPRFTSMQCRVRTRSVVRVWFAAACVVVQVCSVRCRSHAQYASPRRHGEALRAAATSTESTRITVYTIRIKDKCIVGRIVTSLSGESNGNIIH